MFVNHDLHVHSFLSSCANDPSATAENILRVAGAAGLRTIGFADHMWDRAVPGASSWYRPQDYEHIARIRTQIPADTGGVRVFVGCETEYCGNGKIGITRETADKLDFVLVPISHFHMTGFTVPETLTESRDVADLMLKRFHEVLDLGLATGIAHPFLPLGFKERVDEIVGLISDRAFQDCFGRAAEMGVSVEITVGFFPGLRGGGDDGWHDETFLRVLEIARDAGCLFHFASDSHSLADAGRARELEVYAARLGLTEDRLLRLS